MESVEVIKVIDFIMPVEVIFHCSLYIRAVSITDSLCDKQGYFSICGLKSRVGYNGARMVLKGNYCIFSAKLSKKSKNLTFKVNFLCQK